MKLQTLRQSELKNYLTSTVKEISQSEMKINGLVNELKRTYSNGIEDVTKKVSNLEKSNYEIKKRVFTIAKDIEK